MASSSGKPFSQTIRVGFTVIEGAWRPLATVLQVIFAPWRIVHDPIAQLLRADDDAADAAANTPAPPLDGPDTSVADGLTASWTDRKLSELSWVGITCALLAGVVSAAFSWRDLDEMFWAAKGLWYGSLIVDLTSISLATQQSLALNRICCYSDRWKRIRAMLGKPKEGQQSAKPRWTQIYVWQVPIMLLNIGLILFVAGLVSEIFAHFDFPMSHVDVKCLVLLVLAAGFSAFTYLASSALLYHQTLEVFST